MATTSTGRSWRRVRIVAPAATAVVLTIGVGACGSGGDSGANLTTAQVTTLIGKALSELKAGRIDDAKKDFEKVLRSDATNKFAHYNLGYIAQTTGDRGETERQYRAALATDPKFGPALYNLAVAVTADGDTGEAISLYRQAITADKKDANSHFNLGLLLRQQGKTAEGNTQVRFAVQLNPALAPQATAQGVPLK
jgi:Tfp pilus assembly protein PilF